MNTEQKRLLTLEQYEVLDTLPEKEFDDIVELACAICDVPISTITLLDSHRQWFKAKIGITDNHTPIELAFCAHAIKNPEDVMVVPDSFQDERFKNNPLATGSPHVRFYAGAPLISSEGVPFGTLCVIDNQPRSFSPEQNRILKILAERVIKQLELRKEMLDRKKHISKIDKELELTTDRLLEVQRLGNVGCWDWDLLTDEIYWSAEMFRLFGIERTGSIVTPNIWMHRVLPEDMTSLNKLIAESLENDLPLNTDFRVEKPTGDKVWLHSQGAVVKNAHGKPIRFAGAVIDVTRHKAAETSKLHYTQALEAMLYTVSHKLRKPLANCLGLAQVMNSVKLSPERTLECAGLLNDFATEMDTYVREVNGFLEDKKVRIEE